MNEKITIWIDNGDKKAELHTETPCCDTNSTLDGSIAAANELSLFAGHKSIPLITAFFKSFNVQNVGNNNDIRKKVNLGTILGVYLPTVQHIFGAIMFLRLFWIVGIMGIGQCIAMTFLCMLCTFLTSISLSAVATNGVIETGGIYFVISRNLGSEFGTAVGLLFYLANACACAMYIVAAVEIFLLHIAPSMIIGGQEIYNDTGLTGMMSNNYRIYGTIILLLIFVVVALGVRFVQYFAPISLVCVLISILAIFAGVIEKSITSTSHRVCYLDDLLLHANAFVSINSTNEDLCSYCNFDNPKLLDVICRNNSLDSCGNHTLTCEKAFPGIPSGVFLGVSLLIYPGIHDITTTFFVVMAIYFPSVTGIMTGTNMSGDLKDPQKSIPQGTMAAQLTTSIIYFFLILSFGSTIAGPVLRDKYGQSMNGSSMVVAELAWPSSWIIMIGAFTSCFGAALQCLCSAPRLLQSIAKDDILPFLRSFQLLTRWNEPFRCNKKEWGDGMTGLILSTAQFSLSKLEGKQSHPKNWRPQLLLIANLPSAENWRKNETNRKLISLASQLKKGRGLTIAVALHEGQSTNRNAKIIAAQMKKELLEEITTAKVHGFCSSLIYESDQLEGALSTLIQSCGIGPLRPNTLLIPYPEELHAESVYWCFLHRLQRGAMQDMCLLVLKGIPYFPENEYRMAGNVDMWWILHDGGLLLLISFLLKQHKVWRNCHLRIFVVVSHDDNKSQLRCDMEKFLYEMRIDADLYARFLEEFATPDISAYEIERSLKNDVSSLSRKKRSAMAQLIPDQNRKQRKNDENEDEPKIPLQTIQAESQMVVKEYPSENFGNNSHLEHLPQFIPFRIAHSNDDVEKVGKKFKCERKFTFSPLESEVSNINRKGLINSSSQQEGHLPEERVIREVHSAVRLNGKVFEKSSTSALVVLNLPEPPKKESALSNYMEYLNVLTHNLRRVLLIRGSGSEVITKYS
ncbi:amino acid permease [Onchocerca flexuosa]|uniref:Amino acid permease n=1 Tax=Onchocerca flexuosa TaxID=387005 RepID=A0A238BQR9_9BILA|nr:amino acid permease [Onchocerca flexuosa]